MSLASRVHEKLRSRLKRMVEKERAATGCAKSAIAKVARKVFMSPASIYRAVNNYGEVQFKAVSQTAIIMHSVGIVKAAASRVRSKRHATVPAELSA